MRGLAAFLFCLGLATANVVDTHYESKNADKDFLVKQKNIFHLLYHVHQPNIYKDQVEIGQTYNIRDNGDKYSDVEAFKHYLRVLDRKIMPKGHIFSPVYYKQMHEAEALFKVFFYAKDYETFYKTACWAREHVNEQMFVYALSIAVLHRPDCQGITLPAPYEIHPYYFFSSEVIEQAYRIKMQGHGADLSEYVHTSDGKEIIIRSNYTGWYVRYNDEQQLSYFTEDIGLNSFYYYYHLDYPFWMNGKEFGLKKDKRGELFYYVHHQILARYYLERLSNGLGEIPQFSWHMPIKTGFYPSLKYFNGMEFPFRPNQFTLGQEQFLKHLMEVEDYESRIRSSIDLGILLEKYGTQIDMYQPDSIEYLASIIECNNDTSNLQYYRYPLFIAKSLLGNSFKPYNKYQISPSALENYQTCLRDPVFYQLFQRYNGFFKQFKDTLPSYTMEELACPGVKIENVEVEKLVTYFDNFDIDITNVVYQNKDEVLKMADDLVIKARQHRLNHLPFTVTTDVYAEKPTKVSIRFFLGPKYDGQGNLLSISQSRLNLFELETFVFDLKAGKNTVKHNSKYFSGITKDWTSSRKLYADMNAAIAGDKQFPLDMSESHNGIPSRLLLPKGRVGGMPFNFFVIISPHVAPPLPQGTGFDSVISSGVGSGARFIDSYAFGYPFDRIIDEYNFNVPNIHVEDVFIFHKKQADVDVAEQH